MLKTGHCLYCFVGAKDARAKRSFTSRQKNLKIQVRIFSEQVIRHAGAERIK